MTMLEGEVFRNAANNGHWMAVLAGIPAVAAGWVASRLATIRARFVSPAVTAAAAGTVVLAVVLSFTGILLTRGLEHDPHRAVAWVWLTAGSFLIAFFLFALERFISDFWRFRLRKRAMLCTL